MSALSESQLVRAVDELVLLAEECIDENDLVTAHYLLDMADSIADDAGVDSTALNTASARFEAAEGDYDGLGE